MIKFKNLKKANKKLCALLVAIASVNSNSFADSSNVKFDFDNNNLFGGDKKSKYSYTVKGINNKYKPIKNKDAHTIINKEFPGFPGLVFDANVTNGINLPFNPTLGWYVTTGLPCDLSELIRQCESNSTQKGYAIRAYNLTRNGDVVTSATEMVSNSPGEAILLAKLPVLRNELTSENLESAINSISFEDMTADKSCNNYVNDMWTAVKNNIGSVKLGNDIDGNEVTIASCMDESCPDDIKAEVAKIGAEAAREQLREKANPEFFRMVVDFAASDKANKVAGNADETGDLTEEDCLGAGGIQPAWYNPSSKFIDNVRDDGKSFSQAPDSLVNVYNKTLGIKNDSIEYADIDPNDPDNTAGNDGSYKFDSCNALNLWKYIKPGKKAQYVNKEYTYDDGTLLQVTDASGIEDKFDLQKVYFDGMMCPELRMVTGDNSSKLVKDFSKVTVNADTKLNAYYMLDLFRVADSNINSDTIKNIVCNENSFNNAKSTLSSLTEGRKGKTDNRGNCITLFKDEGGICDPVEVGTSMVDKFKELVEKRVNEKINAKIKEVDAKIEQKMADFDKAILNALNDGKIETEPTINVQSNAGTTVNTNTVDGQTSQITEIVFNDNGSVACLNPDSPLNYDDLISLFNSEMANQGITSDDVKGYLKRLCTNCGKNTMYGVKYSDGDNSCYVIAFNQKLSNSAKNMINNNFKEWKYKYGVSFDPEQPSARAWSNRCGNKYYIYTFKR